MFLLLRRTRRLIRRHLDARSPRTRLFVARWMVRLRVDTGSIARLAHQFEVEGVYRGARPCWRRMWQLTPHDDVVLMGYLRCAIEAGDVQEACRVFLQARKVMGILPARVVWLAGELLCCDAPREAGRVLEAGIAPGKGTGNGCSPSMFADRLPDVATLIRRLQDVAEGHVGPAQVHVDMARWCFSYDWVATSVRLYAASGFPPGTGWLDQVALWYGQARDGHTPPRRPEQWSSLVAQAQGHADALMALAYTATVCGHADAAADLMRSALASRYAGSPHLAEVCDDALAIQRVLASLVGRSLGMPEHVLEDTNRVRDPVPKRFICGFGWTGSGAVYDAVRAHADFCEFEGAGSDGILNEGSDTEATFIQSYAGLGRLWEHLRAREELQWQWLWDLLRCHVVGLCPAGYSEYKAAAAATNHVRKYGSAYTRVFRTFFEQLAALVESPCRGGLHGLLMHTGEDLCRMLVGHSGGKVVLFNNAVFARDVSMLEIFTGYRAVVVFRDPRDVFVDRMRHDRNHWRMPLQMAHFYRNGLLRYLACKTREKCRDNTAMREVSFERFVRDGAFREQACRWLLEGAGPHGTATYFHPEVSAGNIDIHRGVLNAADRRCLEGEIQAYRRMQRVAAESWRTTVPVR